MAPADRADSQLHHRQADQIAQPKQQTGRAATGKRRLARQARAYCSGLARLVPGLACAHDIATPTTGGHSEIRNGTDLLTFRRHSRTQFLNFRLRYRLPPGITYLPIGQPRT